MRALLNKIEAVKTLVIGDVMLDHYIFGDAQRISPEAPVPVVDVDSDSYVAGGAANVALNLASLSKNVHLAGYIGHDSTGIRLRSLLEEFVVNCPFCYDSSISVPTILKTRVIVRNQQLCRLDREGAPKQYQITLENYRKHIKHLIAEVDVVIFSDYAKGVITQALVDEVMADAREAGTLVAVDPKPKRKLNFHGVDLLTPNRGESLMMAGIELDHHDEFPYEAVCEAIWKKYQPKNLIVTLGAEGMLISKDGQLEKIIPTRAREVYDVSGAGDTVIAALALAMASGASPEDSAHFANIAAGIVVAKLGTAVVKANEILEEYQRGPIA